MAATRWEACLRTSGPQISAVRHDRSLQLPRGAFILKIGLPHAARRDDCADRRVVGEMMALQPGLAQVLLAARPFGAVDLFAGVVPLGLVGLASSRATRRL